MARSSSFWTAFWTGLAAPVGLYAPAQPYMAYVTAASVARNFAEVGAYLRQTAPPDAGPPAPPRG
ncbi:MAG: hypothetical protein ACP5NP_17910 [Acetobacteraceae bacterium]